MKSEAVLSLIGQTVCDVTFEEDEIQLAFENEGDQTFLYVSNDNVMIVRRLEQPTNDDQLSFIQKFVHQTERL